MLNSVPTGYDFNKLMACAMELTAALRVYLDSGCIRIQFVDGSRVTHGRGIFTSKEIVMTNRTGSKKEAQQRGKKSSEAASRSRTPAEAPENMQSDAGGGNKQTTQPSVSGSKAKQRGNR